MSYSAVLSMAIENSKLSHKEIADKCKELGKSIDPSYISKLANGKITPTKNRVSKILAQVLNIDENKLVLESYLENAPLSIIDFLNNTRFAMLSAALKLFDNTFSNDDFNKVKDTLSNLPLSDFILEINKGELYSKLFLEDGSFTKQIDIENDEYSFTIHDPVGLPVQDNSMYPLIPEGSLVILEIKNKYNDGDIICYKQKDINHYLIRKSFFKGDLALLCPLNAGYDSSSILLSEIVILGKVKKIINNIL